jgi:hypothetical protein
MWFVKTRTMAVHIFEKLKMWFVKTRTMAVNFLKVNLVRKSFSTAPNWRDIQTMTNCTLKVLPLQTGLIPQPRTGLIL